MLVFHLFSRLAPLVSPLTPAFLLASVCGLYLSTCLVCSPVSSGFVLIRTTNLPFSSSLSFRFYSISHLIALFQLLIVSFRFSPPF